MKIIVEFATSISICYSVSHTNNKPREKTVLTDDRCGSKQTRKIDFRRLCSASRLASRVCICITARITEIRVYHKSRKAFPMPLIATSPMGDDHLPGMITTSVSTKKELTTDIFHSASGEDFSPSMQDSQ